MPNIFLHVFVQLVNGVVSLILFPLEEELLRRVNASVLQSFSVIARKHKLHRVEKPGIELWLLVGQVSSDALAKANLAILELYGGDGNAVWLHHKIGSALQLAAQGDFFGKSEVIFVGLLSVDQV